MKEKLSDTETRAWVGFVKSQQILLGKVEQELKSNDLPPLSWYDVLLELDKAEGGKLRQMELGERVLLSKYNISRLLDRLEREQLICRESCTQDARGIFAVITDKGRSLRSKMWPVYYRVVKDYFLSKFNEEELKQLISFQERLI